ncbi:MAG: site-2 protease family protein [Chitinispirillales bacterium]|jgi:Zn-dependent protease|nr:site-2 protease family protein [Chitinispirillales bacterium]
MISGMTHTEFIIRVPAILLALTIHELSHAVTACKLGDPTARDRGRLTFNPLAHLDILGTIMLLTGLFGWAKPVPVNPGNLRNPKRDLMLISAAGPLSNIVQALCCGFIIRAITASATVNSTLAETPLFRYLLLFLILAFWINSGLAFFNLLPLYPLDGSKILAWFLPDRYVESYMRATRYAMPLIFGLVIIGALTGTSILSTILNPVFKPFMYLMKLAAFGNGNI